MLDAIRADLEVPVKNDPSAPSYLEVILAYPGFQAVTAYRLLHVLQAAGVPLVPRVLANVVRMFTGVDIHPGAQLGKGFFIDHGTGVVIGETVETGDNITLFQGVTLGGTTTNRVKRHPTLGNNVTIGANASVLGPITLGDNVKVGSGSVVVKDVPANSTVVGIPAKVVLQDGQPVRMPVPAAQQSEVADAQTYMIRQLSDKVAALEKRLNDLAGTSASYDDVAI